MPTSATDTPTPNSTVKPTKPVLQSQTSVLSTSNEDLYGNGDFADMLESIKLKPGDTPVRHSVGSGNDINSLQPEDVQRRDINYNNTSVSAEGSGEGCGRDSDYMVPSDDETQQDSIYMNIDEAREAGDGGEDQQIYENFQMRTLRKMREARDRISSVFGGERYDYENGTVINKLRDKYEASQKENQ